MLPLSPDQNLILTGIPRSGTTLVCALIDSLQDAICLSEPTAHFEKAMQCQSAADYHQYLVDEFRSLRGALMAGEGIVDKRARDGSALTNYFHRSGGDVVSQINLVEVQRELSPQGLLGIKHNAPYTAILPELIHGGCFRVLAVVRNPIPAILSWRSLNVPVSRGRLPTGEPFWPALRAVVGQGAEDLLATQVDIYNLFCARYLEFERVITTLKYEDVIDKPGLLSEILDRPLARDVEVSRRSPSMYPWEEADEIAAALRARGGAWRRVYSDDELDEAALAGRSS